MKKGTIAILTMVAGVAAGSIATRKIEERDKARLKEYSDKHFAIMLLYNQWMLTKQQGKSILAYLEKKNYKNIAIYGMSYVGERLLEELEGGTIRVKYAIDKKEGQISEDIKLISPDDISDDVDAIIVTSNFYFDAIENSLKDKVSCPIINLEDILYEL